MNQHKSPPSVLKTLRNRLIAGMFVLLPVIITFTVIYWLYGYLVTLLINPISAILVNGLNPEKNDLPSYVVNFLIPITALCLVITIVFIAGMFFNSRLHRFVDWFLNNVPGINLIYSVVSNVFEAIQRSQLGADDFKRVVLVEFPHPGMKAPAFVTSETVDTTTGKDILCIYVPTTPVPTSGYMLLVPEDDVVPLDWDLQETLQAIVSGGITAPKTVRYSAETKPVATIESQSRKEAQ